MTSLTITKTGRIEFEEPIHASTISLKSTTLYMTMYNLTEPTTFARNGKSFTLAPGYYDYGQLQAKLKKVFPSGGFKIHQTTLKVSTDITITGGLEKRIENGYLHLTPRCLYVRVYGIKRYKNLLDGKRSDVLAIIPIGKTDLKEIIEYQPNNNK